MSRPTNLATLARAITVLGLGGLVAGFGGEDPVAGNPWYHEELTERAARSAGFSEQAADELAWHADYIDSYLYNPLWWVQGGLGRLRVALATAPELEKLHFDDNTSTSDTVAAWRRYLSGALAGVLWAADRGDVSAARNILGVSLHAIQDFYAHSNWVDRRDRRARTFLETSRAEREADWLYTGTYTLPDHLGLPVHGKLAPQCLVMTQPAVVTLLSIACDAISPAAGTATCQTFRSCRATGASGSPTTVLGIPVPPGVAYYNPPGIALDSRWMADIAVRERGLTDITGATLFDRAYELALRSSEQWLRAVGSELRRAGKARFWDQVRAPQTYAREAEFEHFDRLPYQFLSAGPYPDDDPHPQWFLRVALETAAEAHAGTDSDIVLSASHAEFPLDYQADESPLLSHDDFEAGSRAVYTLGPFDTLPTSLTITNDASNLGEIVDAALHDLELAFDTAVSTLGDFLLSIVAGHADLIASSHVHWSPAELATVGSSPTAFSLRLNGYGEGDYRVRGQIVRTAATSLTRTYRIDLLTAECLRESDWDRFTFTDEPFFMIVVTPAPGASQTWLSGPHDGVEAGQTRPIARSFTVSVPAGTGSIALAIRAMESDDEDAFQRSLLLAEFAGTLDDQTEAARAQLASAVASAVEADWRLHRIHVHAFTRGDRVHSGTVLDATVDHWIAPGASRTYSLGPPPPVRVPTLIAIDQAFLLPAAALLTD